MRTASVGMTQRHNLKQIESRRVVGLAELVTGRASSVGSNQRFFEDSSSQKRTAKLQQLGGEVLQEICRRR